MLIIAGIAAVLVLRIPSIVATWHSRLAAVVGRIADLWQWAGIGSDHGSYYRGSLVPVT